MPNSAHDYGVEKNLSLNGYSKTGYAFSGWATSAGGNVAYSDGQGVINLTNQNGGVVVLYAVWVPITYSILYSGNGSTGGNTPTSLHTYNLESALSSNGFIKNRTYFFRMVRQRRWHRFVYKRSIGTQPGIRTRGRCYTVRRLVSQQLPYRI
jgi:uncharacterized repeat protein (TIGR02543 family)